MLGIVPTWGNIVVYVTSFFRMHDPEITLQHTFLVFPMTLSMGALSMQLGSALLDILHPRAQLALGGSIFVISILVASFMTNFYLFLVFYAIVTGIGYGIIYMLPLKSAWSFFPGRKGTIGGLILASHSFGAIGWSFFTATSMNPFNEAPSLYLNVGSSLEVLYSPNQTPVKNVQFTFRMVFFIELTLFLFAVALMHKKHIVTFKKSLQHSLLQNDHLEQATLPPLHRH